MRLSRGDVVQVQFDPTVGSEIRKSRPALVVSNEVACELDAVVQVVPLTSRAERPLRPYEARIASHASGVGRPCRAVANQVRTIARERIARRLGHGTPAEIADIDRALLIQLGLPGPDSLPPPA